MPRRPWNTYPKFPPGAKGFEFQPAQTWYPKSSDGQQSQSQYRFARHPSTLTNSMLRTGVPVVSGSVWQPPELDPDGPLAKRQLWGVNLARAQSAPVVAECCPAFVDLERIKLMRDSSGPPRPEASTSLTNWRHLPKDRMPPVRPGEPSATLFPHYQHHQFKCPRLQQQIREDRRTAQMNGQEDVLKDRECGGDEMRLTKPLTYTARMKAKTMERANLHLTATCDGFAAFAKAVAAADARQKL